MKAREILKIIEKDGWFKVRQKGSHRHYKHKTKTGIVTLAFHSLNEDVAIGTLINIFKQAQIDR